MHAGAEDDDFELVQAEKARNPNNIYHSILNVDKNATDLDIKVAYKKLSLLYHPDRHQDDLKEMAEVKFQLIQKAYEVLSNPGKRYLYEKYGHEAVEKSGWAIASQLDKDKLLGEFERRAALEKELERQKSVQSRGEIQLALDATRLVRAGLSPLYNISSYDGERRRNRDTVSWMYVWKRLFPEISHALVVHSWETSIREGQNMALKGTVFAKNGIGHANINLSGRQILSSSSWLEAQTSIGDQSVTALALTHHISPESFLTLKSTFQSFTRLPTSSIMLARNLSDSITTYIRYTPDWRKLWGLQGSSSSSCTIGINFRDETVTYGLDIQASPHSSQITLRQTRSLWNGLYRVRAECGVCNRNGVSITFGGDQQVDEGTRAGMFVECTSISGVTLRLRLKRYGQRFTIPILLSEENDAVVALIAVAVPLAGYLAIDRFFLRSWRLKKKKQALAKLRAENEEMLADQRRQAISATLLLSQTLAKRLDTESKTEGGGLVILQALYGKLPPSVTDKARVLSPDGIQDLVTQFQTKFEAFLNRTPSTDQLGSAEEFIDVTIPVQALVTGGQLHIPASASKSHILGFYDPCFGEDKMLRVVYQVGGQLHSVTVDDTAALDAPLRAHLVK